MGRLTCTSRITRRSSVLLCTSWKQLSSKTSHSPSRQCTSVFFYLHACNSHNFFGNLQPKMASHQVRESHRDGEGMTAPGSRIEKKAEFKSWNFPGKAGGDRSSRTVFRHFIAITEPGKRSASSRHRQFVRDREKFLSAVESHPDVQELPCGFLGNVLPVRDFELGRPVKFSFYQSWVSCRNQRLGSR